MIAADAAFRNAANAAAAAFAQAPPYIAYRTDATVDVPSLRRHKVISRAVETRTRDDYAVLQDLPKGQRQYAHSFPLIPTFDAISYFRLEYNGDRRNALSYVHMEQPITFTDPRATSHSDVVVVSLKYYHAAYAPDSTDGLLHILLEPLPSLTRFSGGDLFLHDVYVDPVTSLPTRVRYTGPAADFTCDYATIENHWLVKHVLYTQTTFAPLHIGRVTFTADVTNSDFRFPATPADPKLAG